jgi:hypothetical protein
VPLSKFRSTGPELLVLIEHALGLVQREVLIQWIRDLLLRTIKLEHQIAEQNSLLFPYQLAKHVLLPVG